MLNMAGGTAEVPVSPTQHLPAAVIDVLTEEDVEVVCPPVAPQQAKIPKHLLPFQPFV